jgi:hypothetical protein
VISTKLSCNSYTMNRLFSPIVGLTTSLKSSVTKDGRPLHYSSCSFLTSLNNTSSHSFHSRHLQHTL